MINTRYLQLLLNFVAFVSLSYTKVTAVCLMCLAARMLYIHFSLNESRGTQWELKAFVSDEDHDTD